MKNLNSNAVRNEVMEMQTTEVKTSSKCKGTLMFIAYLTAVAITLIVLNSFGLIPS